MEVSEILTYAMTALGGGGVTQFLNWRLSKRKEVASVKSDEIDNMRKAMADFYDPLVKKQNTRIAELEQEVKDIRAEKRQMQADYLAQVDALQKDYQAQIASLHEDYQKQMAMMQKQITELYRVLGVEARKQARAANGQFIKSEEEL